MTASEQSRALAWTRTARVGQRGGHEYGANLSPTTSHAPSTCSLHLLVSWLGVRHVTSSLCLPPRPRIAAMAATINPRSSVSSSLPASPHHSSSSSPPTPTSNVSTPPLSLQPACAADAEQLRLAIDALTRAGPLYLHMLRGEHSSTAATRAALLAALTHTAGPPASAPSSASSDITAQSPSSSSSSSPSLSRSPSRAVSCRRQTVRLGMRSLYAVSPARLW